MEIMDCVREFNINCPSGLLHPEVVVDFGVQDVFQVEADNEFAIGEPVAGADVLQVLRRRDKLFGFRPYRPEGVHISIISIN